MWLHALDTHRDQMRSLSMISQAVARLRPKINEISQGEYGDKTLRVEEEEMVLSRYNDASEKQQKYYRHKDSYIHDKNNELHGMVLRKLSMVIFLNENMDQSLISQSGKIRLYPKDGVVDISPRIGRAVLFKSE